MTKLAQLELSCREAQEIIARAEEEIRLLGQSGACEGHRLMATQVLAALRHLGRIVDHHRDHASCAAILVTADRPLRKRPWWTGRWRLARTGSYNLGVRA